MRKTGWIVAAAAGLALAGPAGAESAPAPQSHYDVDKDPCGPVLKQYCAEQLARMDHPAIHACLMNHVDLLPNTCRSTMMPPRPPLRPEPAPAAKGR